MDGSITVPRSVFVNGQWATAHWMADVVDDETGELVITATLAGEGGQGPVVTALRMDMELARQLRAMALSGAEQAAPCYDCRTTGERLTVIERRQEEDAVTFGEHARRLTALETAMRSEHRTMHATFNDLESRLADLEEAIQDAIRERIADRQPLHALANRLDALEAVAAPAIANREWMDEVERQLAALGEGLTAQEDLNLGKRFDFLSKQFLKAMERVDAGLPGVQYMRSQYDAENDAAIVSYWDMQLLNMIETVNGRLGIVAGGA